MAVPTLILASSSPRRAELLALAGLKFQVRTGVCEELWRSGETPLGFAKRVAVEKLQACPRTSGELRLAADTVVWTSPHAAPLGKPQNREHARDTLCQLRDAGTHWVSTAVATDGGPDNQTPHEVWAATTKVEFRAFESDELEAYLDTQEWTDKAGGYGIQGAAAAFVSAIEGSYTNVVGLPLAQVVTRLRALGLHARASQQASGLGPE